MRNTFIVTVTFLAFMLNCVTAGATRGYIYDAETNARLSGVEVLCEVWDDNPTDENGDPNPTYETWIVWNADDYLKQMNPMMTDTNGNYAWLVPPGEYRITAKLTGYTDYVSTEDLNPHNSSIIVPPNKYGVNIAMSTLPPATSAPTATDTPTVTTPPGGNGGGGGGGGGGSASTPSPSPMATVAPTSAPNGLPNEPLPALFELNGSIKYINGYNDGTFLPEKSVTRAETAVMLLRIINNSDKNDTVANNFTDVPAEAWHAQAINYLANKGVLSGYPNGTFLPDNPMSRAEFVTVIGRLCELPLASGGGYFPDVPEDHWAAPYINAFYENGFISGYDDGTFGLNNEITRAEAVTIINKLIEKSVSDEEYAALPHPFIDVPKDHWAYRQILTAVSGM